ncbi:hypothetical protein M0R45_034368 [Rubus argutus]|uniref:Small ribosomal subunit protein mS23 n=1 Tax=Rubus argutus TaxID=59490 RepID=A0AAW1VU37_RUBAR
MSFMKGDLLTKTRKLVKGLANAEPVCFNAVYVIMVFGNFRAPPPTFPSRADAIQRISLPEDVYIKKFFKKHPDSKHEDAIKISAFDPPPARIFGLRVLELKEQGVSEQEAMAVADMEYRAEKKGKEEGICCVEENCTSTRKEASSEPIFQCSQGDTS